MHSLKEKYAKKVKLIYIDPPYNTGNDSFNYNDNFNHSTWLTFMKNRLEVAREFLRDDGVIFIQCDDNEQAYLKVLCDEIFGRENFVANLIWQKKNSGGQHANFVLDFHEYILCYAKNIENLPKFLMQRTSKQKESFTLKDEFLESRGKHLLSPLKSWLDYRATLIYDIECPDGSFVNTQWICSKDTFSILKQEGRIVFKQNKKGEWSVYKKQYENEKGGLVKPPSIFLDCGNSSQATQEIKALFLRQQRAVGLGDYKGDKGDASQVEPLVPLEKENENIELFSTPKPEALLKRIIEISTQENDLVMDFFAGSGTTLAVAHKMKRQWIGIEQMDYVESITKERLKKVIQGEQGGVSKALGWQGGGEFIYAELMPLNALYKEKIKNAKDENALSKIYNDLEKFAFLDYRVDLQEMLKDKEFKDLSLESKKAVLFQALDSNMDYLPLSEIEDKEYDISSELVEINKIFYK